MEEKSLELRMYFFTPSSLGGINKGIACGHAAIEYARVFKDNEQFIDFADNWKTWIILDGGTTNDERDFEGIATGTLNQIGDALVENFVEFSFFREPDLNNSLTAICFIADERVFNKKDYPDFVDYLICMTGADIRQQSLDFLKEAYQDKYKEWIRLIGGVKNEFLRNLIKDKKHA